MKNRYIAYTIKFTAMLVLLFFVFCKIPCNAFECNDVDGAYECIRDNLYLFEEKIKVSKYRVYADDLYNILMKTLKDDPYIFFVDSTMSYECDSAGMILYIYPTYTMSIDDYIDAKRFCDDRIMSALSILHDGMCQAEIALALHDYLCFNYRYDETLSYDNMYTFFKNSCGTCQGYTFAFAACLREVGIECTFAASDGMSHIWNLVRIDGEWYHADLTWDDTPEVFAYCDYKNFLKSDDFMVQSGHLGWHGLNDIKCVSNKYDTASFRSGLLENMIEGDLNLDGVVDVVDIILCGLPVEKLPNNMPFLLICFDMNGDKVTDESDFDLLEWKILN